MYIYNICDIYIYIRKRGCGFFRKLGDMEEVVEGIRLGENVVNIILNIKFSKNKK